MLLLCNAYLMGCRLYLECLSQARAVLEAAGTPPTIVQEQMDGVTELLRHVAGEEPHVK